MHILVLIAVGGLVLGTAGKTLSEDEATQAAEIVATDTQGLDNSHPDFPFDRDGRQRTAAIFTKEVRERAESNPTFVFNTLPTTFPTTESPAYANIIVSSENFLPCQGGPFALCYYSGPQGPLACDRNRKGGIAECNCIEVAYGTYYVDINAILDLETYLQTIEYCGRSGENCGSMNSAPVCSLINENRLIPGADLISVFSFNCAEQEGIGQTACEPEVYAGCMTAPCYRTAGDSGIVECECPTYYGPYQVGKDIPTEQCNLGRTRVWSASYSVSSDTSQTGDMVLTTFPPVPDSGRCIPDDPDKDRACPLWPVDTDLTPESELCQLACQEYTLCTQGDIEVGFTCDATLCTATCADLALVEDACSGLGACQKTAILAVEEAAQCSCCASQICGCEPNFVTDLQIADLNQEQRNGGIVPQCDINGTLCGITAQFNTEGDSGLPGSGGS